MIKFREFPKMPRLTREMIITEKIDGTNASIFIQHIDLEEVAVADSPEIIARKDGYTMRIGSRTKWITPKDDNHGFATWCAAHSDDLFNLGEGHHFGEWWGSGIQCGYDLPKGEKRFSLFNVSRWGDSGTDTRPSCCHVVPELYRGMLDTVKIDEVLKQLELHGSYASPGFMKPEGIVIFHVAGNFGFKKTILKDEIPKSLIV